ncbi:MAG: ABC transporter substrate-binding protein [Anaerolineae bacterium]|nr:ABC transporter substrate-binding protein [Anaerolineae bacterium]
MRKRYLIITLLGVLLVFIVVNGGPVGILNANQEPLYLAMAGPLSGDPADIERGREMQTGIELYLEQVNQAGGINGRKVALIVFDDQDSIEQAELTAHAIAERDNILAVIGHRSSSPSNAAGTIYNEAGIPVITASALSPSVTEGKPWYFRVTVDNDQQGSFAAYYTNKVLKYKTVSIVYVENDFGLSFAAAFRKTTQELNGTIAYDQGFPEQGSLDIMTNQVTRELKAATDTGLVLLAVNDEVATQIVKKMRDLNIQAPIMGSTGSVFVNGFKDYPLERSQPGYYTDGIYATVPHIIYDIVDEKAQDFTRAYQQKYGVGPAPATASHYDAAMILVAAMRATDITGEPETLQQDREKIRQYLQSHDSISSAFNGITGYIYFDEDGDATKPVPVGIYQRQELISAPVQLQLVKNAASVPDLNQEIDLGRIIELGSNYMYTTKIVQTGMHINKISNIDTSTSSYDMDFYLWFEYYGDLDERDIVFTNAVGELSLSDSIAEETRGDLSYKAYHVKGTFYGKFEFYNFPFDQQPLNISFHHRILPREYLIYAVDFASMRSREAVQEDLRARSRNFLPGWTVNYANFFSDNFNLSTYVGETTIEEASGPTYSQFNTTVRIRRDTLRYVLQNVAPAAIFIIGSYLTFFFPLDAITTKSLIGILSLLITAILHGRVTRELPTLDYKTIIEYIYFAVYGLSGLTLLIDIIGRSFRDKDWAQRLNRSGRIAYPIIVLLTGLLIAYIHFNRSGRI